ncbi:hypothetical protein HPP92_006850 [Vanilla planifolia]|uniref:Uncharacterized protein n=1 Tax=Vanilla planifolia TaxID=51239 RepID=A0A835RQ10_VANPL|nr:hypothetical protein HPP92_007081 [Vanilla planifolia]KAG0489987.1 hypothetical protein HPP92_006850 [Vanilla planifolia]
MVMGRRVWGRWERSSGRFGSVEQSTQNCALNVKVKKFNQARVNGGSNYDSLKRNHNQGNGLDRISGERRPCERRKGPTPPFWFEVYASAIQGEDIVRWGVWLGQHIC